MATRQPQPEIARPPAGPVPVVGPRGVPEPVAPDEMTPPQLDLSIKRTLEHLPPFNAEVREVG